MNKLLFLLLSNIDLDITASKVESIIFKQLLLTKLFLKEFTKRDKGCILNVASTAAFTPGPLMASYYATKSYLFSLSSSIYEELRIRKSNVKIKVLCPGPVNTNFNNKLGIKFGVKALTSNYVVKYTLKKLRR